MHPRDHISGIGTREWVLAAATLSLLAVIFVFDVMTPADDVSVCFLYTIPVFLSIFSRLRSAYLYAAAATVLSGVGSFIQPPSDHPSLIFFANRAIAVAAQWAVAILVTIHKDAESLMREDLEQERSKGESRRRFLDVLSHEIGTPLTTISGQAFRLKKLAATLDPSDIAVRTDKIRQAVRQVQSIVKGVHLASEAGERVLRPRHATVDLHALVADAVQHLDDSRGASCIQTELAELPRTILGDPYMLRQIVDNLLSNAVKYSPPNKPIRVRGGAGQGEAVLSVIDQGRGIPDDEREMIFAPYYRARNSRDVHGAGIGLYISARFVANHGGSIGIDSKLGVGTTVTVRLPVEPRPSDERSDPATDPLY